MSAQRYTAQVAARARELRRAGMTPTEVQAQLGRELGKPPALNSIQCWTDPDAEERIRERDRAAKRRARAGKAHTSAFIDRSMLTLRLDDGLSYTAIAKVMRRFYNVDLDAEQVRHRLYKAGAPKNPEKVRGASARSQRSAA